MDDDVYDALFSVLSEAKSLSDWPKNSDTEVKRKYGEGKASEEACPNCGKKFQCYTPKAFLRVVEHCRYTQTTACTVMCVNYMPNFNHFELS